MQITQLSDACTPQEGCKAGRYWKRRGDQLAETLRHRQTSDDCGHRNTQKHMVVQKQVLRNAASSERRLPARSPSLLMLALLKRWANRADISKEETDVCFAEPEMRMRSAKRLDGRTVWAGPEFTAMLAMSEGTVVFRFPAQSKWFSCLIDRMPGPLSTPIKTKCLCPVCLMLFVRLIDI